MPVNPSLMIGMLTRDRYECCEICLRFLFADTLWPKLELLVADNAPEPPDWSGLDQIVREIERTGTPAWKVKLEPEVAADSVEAKNKEIGLARQWLVNEFLDSEHMHLLLLDDDILVSMGTVIEALADLKSLLDFGVGAMSLHPFAKRFKNLRYFVGDKVFRTFDYTGEACLLLTREALEYTGNAFGLGAGGFADDQFAALAAAGYTCCTRVSPPYRVQHLGIAGLAGSLVYGKEKKQPAWTKSLFRDYLTGEPFYGQIVGLWRQKGPGVILRELRSGGVKMEEKKMRDVKKKTQEIAEFGPVGRGELVIEVQTPEGKKVEEHRYENLVVNNGKAIMAHLLAGDTPTTYAITQMAFGTGTTTPAVTDASLAAAITPVKTVTADYPDSTSVRFTATLASDECNTFPIAEAGLYSDSQGMFSRTTFGPLTKSSDFQFVFRWSIYWS